MLGSGYSQITERGKEVLDRNPPNIDHDFRQQFPEYVEWKDTPEDGR